MAAAVLSVPHLKAAEFDPALVGSSYQVPLQLKDWPVSIGPESQLFVDDYLIHSRQGIIRIPHQPAKYPGNPILVADKPWEAANALSGGLYANGTIVFDPEARQYRMYYNSAHLVAFSKDGLDWTKPNLGIVSFEGSRENNIVMGFSQPTDMGSVIYDPRDPDPNRRWKAALYHYDRGENPRWSRAKGVYGDHSGLYGFFSPDGLRWSSDAVMLIPGRRGPLVGATWPLTGTDDVSIVTWDGRLKKFVAWLKIWDLAGGRYYRARAMAFSDDFEHWSTPWAVLLPDKLDPPDAQFYAMDGWPYESMWVGMLKVLHSATGTKPADFQLITSHDGVHWERAGNRAAFIPNGPDGSYDHGYHTNFSNPPIRFGDKLHFYYASTAMGKDRVASRIRTGICLATLRVDGFASLHRALDAEVGEVITRPLDFSGRTLTVNALASDGPIRVEVLGAGPDDDLKPIPGYTARECAPVDGDGIAQSVSWRSNADLSGLAGRRIRLRFILSPTSALYSFAIR